MEYILTTIAGVESIAKKELEKIGAKVLEVTDRAIEFEGDDSIMIKANLWSRVGNKVYRVLTEGNVKSFDDLYDLINSYNFKKLYHKDFPIIIKAKVLSSDLVSVPSIQKISKKAIIDNITDKSGENVDEDKDLENMSIMILIKNNYCKVLLDTSGDALHKRGYREETGEAPIKESLAAALVLLSGWRFKETFYDMFCGSGTIAIEAAMIAKNIAPGLDRYFAFEKLGLVKKKQVEEEIEIAKYQSFSGEYKIIASDIDEKVLEIAKENAKDAGVYDMIDFKNRNFKDYIDEGVRGTIVSNPPYGDRLKDKNIDSLYKFIDKLFRVNPELGGGVITSYLDFDNLINLSDYKKRKLYNGGEKTYFYKRKQLKSINYG